MNGFMPTHSPRFCTLRAGSVSARSLSALALALAGWLSGASASSLFAQESEAPTAPPALTNADVPAELFVVEPTPVPPPVKARPARPLTRKPTTIPKEWATTTQNIPTGPAPGDSKSPNSNTGRFGETTELIPTEFTPVKTFARKRLTSKPSVWAAPEKQDEQAVRPIRQVQALVPDDGLILDPIEGTEPVAPLNEAAPFEPGQAPVLEEAPLTSEPALEEPGFEAIPADIATHIEEQDAEPAPLNNRVGTPQRVPQSHINRTAAAEPAPYNEQGAAEFSAKDAIHTVAAGDSFWSISKKHYGLGRYSAALAAYNKSRIPQPDKIKPGMKVIVPSVQTLEQKFTRLISGASASAAETTAPVKSGFFVDANGQPMYRIGEGDTLSTIAQDHLGRSSRWTLIAELNRDTLPNPDEMKLGTVLRLPADASDAIKTN